MLSEMIRTLVVKGTTKEAWEAIRVGTDRVGKSTVQKLRREWELLTFSRRLCAPPFWTMHNNVVDEREP